MLSRECRQNENLVGWVEKEAFFFTAGNSSALGQGNFSLVSSHRPLKYRISGYFRVTFIFAKKIREVQVAKIKFAFISVHECKVHIHEKWRHPLCNILVIHTLSTHLIRPQF